MRPTLTDKQLDRFFANIGSTHDCWLWTGTLDKDGYGQFSIGTRTVKAHRVSYELFIGRIPDELEPDHLCSVRNCICPTHLEPVTHQENVRRGKNHWRDKTHCPKDHPYSGENLITTKRGTRECRKCKTAAYQRNRK